MKNKVKILSDHLINTIKAGEVIENPASVVKELVDNALDADATKISIDIACGGRESIIVKDNGIGMTQEDALLSFERHATSKIETLSDIESLSSMGFRGEALPSIASVSKVKLTTNEKEDPTKAFFLQKEGEETLTTGKAHRNKGTTVEVRSLFYNVPVRRKFQRSPHYDAHEVLATIRKLSLAYPFIDFRLTHNKKVVLDSPPPQKTFKETFGTLLAHYFGKEFFSQFLYFEQTLLEGTLKIKGFLSFPEHTRPNKTMQFIFLNQRPISSPFIAQAIKEGYASSIPPQRFPLFFIHMDLPGDLVDINVHPQKKEVRFRREFDISESLRQSVSKLFSVTHTDLTPTVQTNPPPPSEIHPFTPHDIPVSKITLNPNKYLTRPSQESSPPPFKEELPLYPEEKLPTPFYFLKGYMLTESLPDAPLDTVFTLFDQRALVGRILFDKMAKKKNTPLVASQRLLLPFSLLFTHQEVEQLTCYTQEFEKVGLEIEKKNEETLLILALPDLLNEKSSREFLESFLEKMHLLNSEEETRLSLFELREKLLDSLTCTALPGRTHLSPEQAQALFYDWKQCTQQKNCPKGSPIYTHIDYTQLTQLMHRQKETQ